MTDDSIENRPSLSDKELKWLAYGFFIGIAFTLLVVFVTGYNFAGQAQCL